MVIKVTSNLCDLFAFFERWWTPNECSASLATKVQLSQSNLMNLKMALSLIWQIHSDNNQLKTMCLHLTSLNQHLLVKQMANKSSRCQTKTTAQIITHKMMLNMTWIHPLPSSSSRTRRYLFSTMIWWRTSSQMASLLKQCGMIMLTSR